MIIYKDFISDKELLTDAFRVNETDDGIFYEVEGKLTTQTTDFDDALIGANKSAEAEVEDEGVAEQGVSGCNIVLSNRLEEQQVDKKAYKKYIKLYMKQIVKRLQKEKPDAVATFQANAKKAMEKILEKWDDWQFFHAEGDFDVDNEEKAEGMLALMGWRPDGTTPYMLFFKDGLVEEKA